MTPPPTADRTDGSLADRLGARRRPILKALGGGAALSLGAGAAPASAGTADDHDGDDGGDAAVAGALPRPPHLDSYYGFTSPDADAVPDFMRPSEEVELHTVPPDDPDDPDRPTFFFFDPVGIHVQPGDVVQFSPVSPDHTVTAYHPALGFQRRVPEGTPPFSSPVLNAGGAWLYQFDREGVYDLYCGPHHILGMAMRVVVGDIDGEDVPDYEDDFEPEQPEEGPPLLPPFSAEFLEHELNGLSDSNEDCEWPWLTPAEVLDADRLDPADIQATDTGMSFETVVGELGYDFDH